MSKTQIIIQQTDGHTTTHVTGDNKAIANSFEDAAFKDYRIMSGCFYVVLRVLEQENPQMFELLKVAHSGIHPSRLIESARVRSRRAYINNHSNVPDHDCKTIA